MEGQPGWGTVATSNLPAALADRNTKTSSLFKGKGFSDVRLNKLEVAAGKDAAWVSIGHSHIADRKYWEIVMAAGEGGDRTKRVNAELVTTLKGITTF